MTQIEQLILKELKSINSKLKSNDDGIKNDISFLQILAASLIVWSFYGYVLSLILFLSLMAIKRH